MAVINDNETLLLVIERERVIAPIVASAFRATQSTGEKLERYKGSLVISREGRVFMIQKVVVEGLYGSSLLRKMRSALFGTRNITVSLVESKQMSLSEFKSLVIRYLGYDRELPDPYLPQSEPLELVSRRVTSAESFAEVFQQINFPPPQDCLDML